MASLIEIVKIFFHGLFFWISNLYALPVYVVWMSLLTPVRIVAPDIYWRIEPYVFHLMTCSVISWVDKGGYRVFECGADISKLANKRALVLANHQSTADTPMLFLPFFTKGGAGGAGGRLMWIMWKVFKFTNFGLVSWMRGDFFIEVEKGAQNREQQLVLMKEHLKDYYIPNRRGWLVVFPEGGFLYKRKESSQRYAKKHGFPHLNHVTLPRLGGTKLILDTIGEPYNPTPDPSTYDPCADLSDNLGDTDMPLQWIIDVTIAYQDAKPPGFFGMAHGYEPQCDTVFHYRAFRVRDIPRDDAGLLEWLAARYVEKDAWLDEYYRTGEVPREGVWDTCGAGVQSYGYQVVNKLVKTPSDEEIGETSGEKGNNEVSITNTQEDVLNECKHSEGEKKQDLSGESELVECKQSEGEKKEDPSGKGLLLDGSSKSNPSGEGVLLDESDKSSKLNTGVFKQDASDQPLLRQIPPTLMRFDLVLQVLCHATLVGLWYLQHRFVTAPAFGLVYSLFEVVF